MSLAKKKGTGRHLRRVPFFLILILLPLWYLTVPPKGVIPVLMYHFVVPKAQNTSLDISVEAFEGQMRMLKTLGYRAISLDEFYEIKTGRKRARGKELVITFDDGSRTYLEHALPVLERHQIPSANFLVWESLIHTDRHGSMSLDEAKALSQNPLVTLGSHSLTHANLSEAGRDQARAEVIESKRKLEKAIGKKFDYFSYPEGGFNEEIVELVKEAEYKLAFTTARKRLGGSPETLFSITRFKVHPKHNLFVFWLVASGLNSYAKQIEAAAQNTTKRRHS